MKSQMTDEKDSTARRSKDSSIPAAIKRQIDQITEDKLQERVDERRPSAGLKYQNPPGYRSARQLQQVKNMRQSFQSSLAAKSVPKSIQEKLGQRVNNFFSEKIVIEPKFVTIKNQTVYQGHGESEDSLERENRLGLKRSLRQLLQNQEAQERLSELEFEASKRLHSRSGTHNQSKRSLQSQSARSTETEQSVHFHDQSRTKNILIKDFSSSNINPSVSQILIDSDLPGQFNEPLKSQASITREA